MAAVRQLNAKAEVLGRSAALAMSCGAGERGGRRAQCLAPIARRRSSCRGAVAAAAAAAAAMALCDLRLAASSALLQPRACMM